MNARNQATILMAMLVSIESIFVGVSFESLPACLLMLLLASAVRWTFGRSFDDSIRNSTSIGTRKSSPIFLAFGYVLLIGVVCAWRLTQYTIENLNPVVLIVDGGAHSAVACMLLTWCRQGWRGQLMMLALGVLVSLLCSAGGGVSRSSVAQLAVGLATGVGFLFASQQILRFREFRRLRNHRRSGLSLGRFPNVTQESDPDSSPPYFSGTPLVYLLLVMSAVLTATSLVSNATSAALPTVQKTLRDSLNESLQNVTAQLSIGTGRYVSGSTLGGVRREILTDPSSIALTGRSATAPGYLRGTTFALYSSRSWRTAERHARLTDAAVQTTSMLQPVSDAQIEVGGNNSPERFRFNLRQQTEDSTVKFQLRNDPARGQRYFGPLGGRWVEAQASEIRISVDGVILEGLSTSQPYVWGTTDNPPTLPIGAWHRDVCSYVPYPLQKICEQRAEQICGSARTAREKASLIEAYFQDNYTYSLSHETKSNTPNPIANFLDQQHPAHCEYFATAAALLLRSVGVPTRYVTGYVMDEYNDETESWVARNSDAHAWVEAYDEATRTWFSVEATPGRSYQTVSMDAADTTNELPAAWINQDTSDEDEWWIVRAWNWLLIQRGTDTLLLLLRFAQAPLFAFIVVIMFVRYRRTIADEGNKQELKSRAMLRQADKIVRRYRYIRKPGETLHTFANRLDAIADGANASDQPIATDTSTSLSSHVLGPKDIAKLRSIATWYRSFADARFGDENKYTLPAEPKRWIHEALTPA